ncbi:MAG: hypothetical protein J5528_04625 [Firmicutes bacterium]|nr:hypothetical protein [Bacillota bacterium]
MKKMIRTTALLTLLSLVVGIFPAAAFAGYDYTEQNMTVYNPAMVSYYWGWDKDWSVPYLTLSNGWHCSATETLYGFTAYSYRGKVGYCFAPGVVFSDQATYYSKQESYFDSVADEIPGLSKDELIELTGYVLAYSFKGDLKQSYFEDESSGKDAFGHIWASQVLIWELIVGERDSDFNYLGPQEGCSACKEVIRTYNPIYGKFMEHYSDMEKAVKKALHYPSFAGEGEANTYTLKWNGSNYSLTLEDSNGVLEGYSLSADSSNVRLTRDGNTLTVSSDIPLEAASEVRLETVIDSDSFMVWGSAGQNDFGAIKDDPYSYNQTLVFNTGTVSVNKSSSFYVKTEAGEVMISKVSANCPVTDGNNNYSLEGAVYGVYTSGDTENASVDESTKIGEIRTDENGKGSILSGISAGRTYYIKEIYSPKGYLLDENVYAVTPDGTGENAAVVESVEDPVNDPIAITIFKENALYYDDPEADTSDIPTLEGTEFTIKYYDADPDEEYTAEDLEEMTPARTWVVTVKESEMDGKTVYKTQLSPEYLVGGSDDLYLSEGGEAILPVGYFTVRETKASPGYTIKDSRYYSGGELIGENGEAIVGKVDYDGNISPEGINTGALCMVNKQLEDPEEYSPGTGGGVMYCIMMVISLAMLVAYIDYERRKRSIEK